MKVRVDIRKTLRSHGREFKLDASFEAEHDSTVVFGPSGSGKSLTMQCIAGLVRPDEGRIQIGERVLFDSASGIDLRPQLRNVGFVFQDYALFPHLTVEKNIAFGLHNAVTDSSGGRCDRSSKRIPDAVRTGAACAQLPTQSLGRTTAARCAGACADPPTRSAAAGRAAVSTRSIAARPRAA